MFPKPTRRVKVPKPRKEWRRADDDKVTPEVAAHVQQRDGGCMTPALDPGATICHDQWGSVVNRRDPRAWTLQHVHLEPGGTKGDRAPSDPEHLLVLCWGHHEGRGEQGGFVWATVEANLELQRAHLLRLAAEGRA